MPATDFKLTDEQQKVHDAIMDFFRSQQREKEYMTIGGYAGTGKTTLVSKTVDSLAQFSGAVAFCAYTGKAASILRGKLEDTLWPDDFVGTIHSLIYKPVEKFGVIRGWKRRAKLETPNLKPYKIIIVDEASMVSGDIMQDLLSFGIPVVFVGDHGQLPPVNGRFNLMQKPDFKLETIHRQAEGNPIIKLSMLIRENGRLPHMRQLYDAPEMADPSKLPVRMLRVEKNQLPDLFNIEYRALENPLVLCGFNTTRVYLNKLARRIIGIKSYDPIVGDKVICLRNNAEAGIYNGLMGTLQKIERHEKNNDLAVVAVELDGGGTFEGEASKYQFHQEKTPGQWDIAKQGNLFDFGYCLTVHKAQGSESKNVILFNQRMPDADDRLHARWLYTGVTRAKENLAIIERA